MTHYETVFILTPVLSESQVEEAVNKFNDFVTANGGEIVAKENWGLKKLAYSIQNKRNGFYHLVEFKTENAELVSQLEVAYKRDERVLRFLTVKLDKHGVEWAEKRRTKLKSNSNK